MVTARLDDRKGLRRTWLLGLAGLAMLLGGCPTRDAECGDARVDEGEECDDGNTVQNDDCTNACGLPACGDGVLQTTASEECDDGNDADGDDCTAACRIAVCGDGFLHEGVEECDDGNLTETDGCLMSCLLPSCGDGVTQAGEECDDGNLSEADECMNDCTIAAVCGDGFVRDGVEECDDGNNDSNDGCLDCVAARCGDGFVNEGVEQCDPGDPTVVNFCSASCQRRCDLGVSSGVFNDRCYMVFEGPIAWDSAGCEALGAHFVQIDDSLENEDVRSLLTQDGRAWIGLSDALAESLWLWKLGPETFVAAGYTNWANAQPDNNAPANDADCAMMDQPTGLWLDEPCDVSRAFVCEYEW